MYFRQPSLQLYLVSDLKPKWSRLIPNENEKVNFFFFLFSFSCTNGLFTFSPTLHSQF